MKKSNNKHKAMLDNGYLLVALALLLGACGTPSPEPAPEPTSKPPPVTKVDETPDIVQPVARWNLVTEAGTWELMS